MVRIVVLTTLLVLLLALRIEAHGHHHHHHHAEREGDQHGGGSIPHEHGHEEDHDHPFHSRDQGSHEHSHAHSHDHSHAHDGEESLIEKHLHSHTHGRGRNIKVKEGKLEEHSFDWLHRDLDSEHHGSPTLTTAGLWLWAMGSSLLVSLASLISLILLPLIFSKGKPSRTVVDALAGFGAGSMLGDALLHQLPHAFGGSGAHSHDHDHEGHGRHNHAHSLEDLSVGLAVLGGVLVFFLVEKIVRRAEELSVHRGHTLGHTHHHHRPKKDDEKINEDDKQSLDKRDTSFSSSGGIRKRNTAAVKETDTPSAVDGLVKKSEPAGAGRVGIEEMDIGQQGEGDRLALGYLNLFSDGVHNFTDGMALGSAFLLHGTVGGWSRTLFLLAHELPQEVGDFGILLRSGFGVVKALAFNFLSALVALLGTALALILGGNSGHSALIEGFTAGGFIYIAVGAVMPDMHSQGSSLRTTLFQLTALSLGMGVAIVISLAE